VLKFGNFLTTVPNFYQTIRNHRENFRAGAPPVGKFYEVVPNFYGTLALAYEVEAKNDDFLCLKNKIEIKIYEIEALIYKTENVKLDFFSSLD
jgi:hypothetical protein